MVNVLDFGAVKGGKVLCREAFQKAVDACALTGGGTVFVPSGTYLLATVFLKDNIHIVFENGAKILGSTDLDNDFAPDEDVELPVYQDVSHTMFHHSLFVAINCKHVSVTGGGIIDMQGKFEDNRRGVGKWPDGSIRGAKVIAFKGCTDVTLSDFSIYHGTDIAVLLSGCHTVRCRGLYIDTHIDGINPDCCVDTVISDCIIHSGDDGIVPKSSCVMGEIRMTENMVITNCIISSDCSAIKFGTESSGGFRNITVSNCVISNTREAGLSFETVDGGILEGITVTNITEQNVGCPFIFIIGGRMRTIGGYTNDEAGRTKPEDGSIPDFPNAHIGTIRNISISHFIHTGPYFDWKKERCHYFVGKDYMWTCNKPAMLCGLPGHNIENIHIEDVHMQVKGGTTEDNIKKNPPEDWIAYPNPTMYGDLPATGFFMRHCNNITLRDVSVETIAPDAREEIWLDDVENFKRY